MSVFYKTSISDMQVIFVVIGFCIHYPQVKGFVIFSLYALYPAGFLKTPQQTAIELSGACPAQLNDLSFKEYISVPS